MSELFETRDSHVTGALFSSTTDEWATPQDFFDMLDAEFGFELDVCANADNAKCDRYYSKADDGLTQPWCGVCWMNPPYGTAIGDWIRKAFVASVAGATVVCLIPARTDTAYWHKFVMKADEVRLIRGRLRFGSGENSAPFPSAVVVFRPERTGTLPTFSTIERGLPDSEQPEIWEAS